MKHPTPESIGKRIARLRQEHNFTQQTLAERLAISRVAVSHIEADLTIPSERTITLLAGLFKYAPHKLVEGTTYPAAKAERLPYVVAWYTELELDLALLKRDLEWIYKDVPMRTVSTPPSDGERMKDEVQRKWKIRLAQWDDQCLDEHNRGLLKVAYEWLREGITRE